MTQWKRQSIRVAIRILAGRITVEHRTLKCPLFIRRQNKLCTRHGIGVRWARSGQVLRPDGRPAPGTIHHKSGRFNGVKVQVCFDLAHFYSQKFIKQLLLNPELPYLGARRAIFGIGHRHDVLKIGLTNTLALNDVGSDMRFTARPAHQLAQIHIHLGLEQSIVFKATTYTTVEVTHDIRRLRQTDDHPIIFQRTAQTTPIAS